MNKVKAFVALGSAVLASAAWGTDCVVERAASAPAAPEPAATDGTLELKWDSGVGAWWLVWVTASGIWIGNDFDISTISTYRGVTAIKLQSRNTWPNARWDGFRIGIFSFSGGVPGSLIWGPKFVVPTGETGWKEFSVGWTLPASDDKFLAGQAQFYNYPNCDPFLLDNNPTFQRHSWRYISGNWQPMTSSVDPYRNIMLRVIVDNSTLALRPTSIGRVKALYY